MIRIVKNESKVPKDYLDYIASKKYRQIDLEANFHLKTAGRDIFKKIKKRKNEFLSLKTLLIDDQGHICCYCNQRVYLKGSTVEHIVTIDENKFLLAEYSNLLIACNGGRIELAANQNDMEKYPLYCDAGRNDRYLEFSPLDDICELAFVFDENGNILGQNKRAELVIEVLNLNDSRLVDNRFAALEIIRENEEFLPNSELELIWENLWERDESNKHTPFFFIILNVIYDLF